MNAPAVDKRDVLVSLDSFMTTLIVVLIDEFGTAALAWDAETLRLELVDTFGVTQPATVFDKMLAGIAMLTTDRFYKSLADFVDLVPAIIGCGYAPGQFDPLGCGELAWAISEALLIEPPEDPDNAFTQDIRLYIGRMLDREGIIDPPDVLRVALRSGNRRADIAAIHGNDATTMSTINKVESAKTNEINETIKLNLTRLLQQISTVRLTNGNAFALPGLAAANREIRRTD